MAEPLKRRILVVDDEACIREVFDALLQQEGYEVATAENGFDALLQLRQFLPDLVISDLNMPKMSGFEFLSVLRRRFPKVLVIASSGAFGSAVVPDRSVGRRLFCQGTGATANPPKQRRGIAAELQRTNGRP